MKKFYFGALLIVAILCASCGMRKESGRIDLAMLEGSSWVLTHMDGIEIEEEATQTATFSIRQGRISGKATCNSYGGDCLAYSDGRIEISNIMATRMACMNMMYEHIFLAALQEAKVFRLNGANELMLYTTSDASGQPSLTFHRK